MIDEEKYTEEDEKNTASRDYDDYVYVKDFPPEHVFEIELVPGNPKCTVQIRNNDSKILGTLCGCHPLKEGVHVHIFKTFQMGTFREKYPNADFSFDGHFLEQWPTDIPEEEVLAWIERKWDSLGDKAEEYFLDELYSSGASELSVDGIRA